MAEGEERVYSFSSATSYSAVDFSGSVDVDTNGCAKRREHL